MRRLPVLRLAITLLFLCGIRAAAQSPLPGDVFQEGSLQEIEFPSTSGDDSTLISKDFMGIVAASALQHVPTLPQAVSEKIYQTGHTRGKFRLGMFHKFRPFAHLKVPSIHFHDPYFNTFIGELMVSTKSMMIGLSLTASRNGAGVIFSFDRLRGFQKTL